MTVKPWVERVAAWAVIAALLAVIVIPLIAGTPPP